MSTMIETFGKILLGITFFSSCLAGPVLKPLGLMPTLSTDSDADLNVTQIIQRWGYPVENHEVITSDGYILQIQRIPHGVHNTTVGSRVAFLQHGLLSSAFDYVANLPNQSLAFILADQGYDVWLGNVRGNTYSRRHVNISADQKEFWKFSFDQYIDYDIPAMIDYTLEKTGQESLYYVGHSQGTIVMFGLLSDHMEYQKKIKAFAALAPVANLTTVTSPIRYLAPVSDDVAWILEWLGDGEFGKNSRFTRYLAKTVCAFSLSRALCEDAIFLFTGLDTNQLNITRTPVYLSHTPAGTSVMNLVHYGQEIQSKRFQRYDYGTKVNKKVYGQPAPPEYNLKNIHETPTALFWSQNDWLADPSDVQIIVKTMPSVKESHEVPEAKFTHLDFVLGMTAKQLVYDDLLKFFSKY